jgi:CRISPR-associated endoribonuclease Cas6
MRLNLQLTANTEPVPFNHLHRLTGFLHRCIGENDLHEGLSLFSFGWLQGGRQHDAEHLTFPQGAAWRVSFHDPDAAKHLIDGLMQNPQVFGGDYGMRVYEVKEQETPSFSGCYRFKLDRAPVIARRRRDDGSREYLLADDEEADAVMTRLLRRKLEKAGYDEKHRDASVQFDRTYQNAHTKLAEVKGTQHKGSVCPVVVEGTPEAVRFAWQVGVGELTGSGFGALR